MIIETIGSYFLWVLDSIVVLFVVNLITLGEPRDKFERGEGLQEENINKLQKVVAGENLTCGICLENVVEGMIVKELPGCQHQFHEDCIDEWLRRRALCPYCRREVVELLQ